jgi:hypothetical protein
LSFSMPQTNQFVIARMKDDDGPVNAHSSCPRLHEDFKSVRWEID